jgi:LAGLIDADG DNA endonuclease family/Proton-conducting membrane transporter
LVGISSYLLVSFWFTRVQANKSAISALLFNRVGDMFLTIGLFAVLFAVGNIDYATVFSVAPYLNENIVTIVGVCFLIGAMAKSAQIGLHVWLPQAMEGKRGQFFKKQKKRFIYNKPYSNLNKQKLSGFPLEEQNPEMLDAIVGDLLGDGSINRGNYKRWPGTNGRLEFTFSISNLAYLRHLKFNIYSSICTSSEPTPWPNILFYPNKTVTQYWFSSRRLPFLTDLHNIWYKSTENNFIKILPDNISSSLKPIGLAHWIMGDGYFSEGTVYLSTDNFTKEEVEQLIRVLQNNFNLKATIKIRINSVGLSCFRIRFSSKSLNRLKELVVPYFIPEMLYKLNISKENL